MEREMTMIERVARAICKAYLEKAGEEMFRDGTLQAPEASAAAAATLRAVDGHWRNFIEEAIAAVKEMRDPTGQMELMMDRWFNLSPHGGEGKRRYQDLIDAALKEHEGEQKR